MKEGTSQTECRALHQGPRCQLPAGEEEPDEGFEQETELVVSTGLIAVLFQLNGRFMNRIHAICISITNVKYRTSCTMTNSDTCFNAALT
jgi:hypothetical protein